MTTTMWRELNGITLCKVPVMQDLLLMKLTVMVCLSLRSSFLCSSKEPENQRHIVPRYSVPSVETKEHIKYASMYDINNRGNIAR